MKCPVCNDELIEVGPGARRCPNRHGLVVSAKVLKDGGAYAVRADTADGGGPAASTARVISCPNCLSQMLVVDYAGSGIMIDTCFSCPYRWLDAGELTKIAERTGRGKSRLSTEHMTVLERLGNAMAQEPANSED